MPKSKTRDEGSVVYRDVDGNVVSLSELCRRDPEWAANRIRALTAQATETEPVAQEWSPSNKRVEAYRTATTRLDRVAALNHSLQDFIEDTDPPNRRALMSLLTDYICAVEGVGERGATESKDQDPDAPDVFGLRHGRVHRDPGRGRAARTARATESKSKDGEYHLTAEQARAVDRALARSVEPAEDLATECKSVVEVSAALAEVSAAPEPDPGNDPGPERAWIRVRGVGVDQSSDSCDLHVHAVSLDTKPGPGTWREYVRADLARTTDCGSVAGDGADGE